MSFTADFSRYTKYRDDSAAKVVRFAAGAPALETEFNEIQEISNGRMRDAMAMFGNGLLGEGTMGCTNGTFVIDNERAIVDGVLVYISHLSLNVNPGDNIYLDVFDKEVNYKDVMRKYGNEQEVAIPNYILDERFGKEISKRIIVAYNLSKTNSKADHHYLKLGSINASGKFVSDNSCVIKTFEANDISITISKDGWQEDNAASMHRYYKDVSVDLCSDSMIPILTVHPASMQAAVNCGMASTCQTLEGMLRIWSYTPPKVDIKASLYLSGYTSGYRMVRARSGGAEVSAVLPVASETQLGGVRIRNGSGLKVDANGNLSLDFASREEVINSFDPNS